MFKLVKEPLAWVTVAWDGVTEAGDPIKHSIRVKCALLTVTELRKQSEAVDEAVGVEWANAFVKRVGREWEGVGDEHGVLAFTPENIARMVDEVPNFATAFEADYMKAWRGQVETREKN